MIYRCTRHLLPPGYIMPTGTSPNPLFHIVKRAFKDIPKMPKEANMLVTPPNLLQEETLKASIKTILAEARYIPSTPFSSQELRYVDKYLSDGSCPYKQLNELGPMDPNTLVKILTSSKAFPPIEVLANLHLVRGFQGVNLHHLEGFYPEERCTVDVLPEYVSTFYKKSPKVVEPLLLNAVKEMVRLKCEPHSITSLLEIITPPSGGNS